MPSEIPPEPTLLSEPREYVANKIDDWATSREELLERLNESLIEVKPKLRGFFHLISLPLVIIGGLFLLVFTPTLQARASVAVFVFASITLFSVSSVYHRTNGWVSARMKQFLHQADHTSITVLIAGTATPFAVLLLEPPERTILLSVVWIAVLVLLVVKFTVKRDMRWLNVLAYVGLGWAPAFFLFDFYRGATAYGSTIGVCTFTLIVVGGALYSIGGILFAWRPSFLEIKENYFGFHEIFHLFTILAFCCHYSAISIIAYNQ